MNWLVIFLAVSLLLLSLALLTRIVIWYRHSPFTRGVSKAMSERYPFSAWEILLAHDRLLDFSEVARLCEFCQASGRPSLLKSIQDFQSKKSPGH